MNQINESLLKRPKINESLLKRTAHKRKYCWHEYSTFPHFENLSWNDVPKKYQAYPQKNSNSKTNLNPLLKQNKEV